MRKWNLLFLITLAASLCAWNLAGCGRGSGRTGGVYYLEASQSEFRQFPAAPLPGSDTDKKDFATLHEWQNKRTPAECARARSEADGNFEVMFGGISPFIKPLPPEAAGFFKRAHSDLDKAVGAVKNRNKRPRPYKRDPGLHPIIYIWGYSYPSGHAVNARVFALILSYLVPERRGEFLARADEAGLDRVIAGVHYPSDIEAGKLLGEEIYAQFLKNPVFRNEMELLRRFLSPRTKKTKP